MPECSHESACLDLARDGSDAWVKACECGVTGGGHSLQEAWRVFDINAKRAAGEKLSDHEWLLLAYTPVDQGGTAAGCCPTTVAVSSARSFLLGSL